MAELTASTGQKEPGSIYSYLQGAAQLATAGVSVYNSITGRAPAPQSGPQQSAQAVATTQQDPKPGATWQKYLPLGIGALVVVALFWFINRK